MAAEVLALGPCLAVAFGGGARPEVAQEEPRARAGRLRGAVLAGAALTAAAGIAFLRAPWPVVVGAWLLAAAVALSAASGRPRLEAADGVATALAWTGALAALSLFLVNPNADDSEYVHLSSWVAAHGSFPVGDTLFSDQSLPAIFFPPLNSYEALVGAFARTTELQARDVVYFAVPPAAAALSVLALWRLLRGWRVRSPALALSLALGFLLMDAAGMRTFGSFWLARIWQGKVIFVAVLVPLLLALLLEHAERPTRRGAVLLAAASVAAVGLTTTAMFVVPVLAAGCLVPRLLSARRPAAVALLATIAYPLAAGALTLAVGGRNPQVYTAADVVPRALVRDVFGHGPVAFIAVAAVLAGPVLIRSAAGARMTAGVVLAVGLLFVPGVTLIVFHVTGLGEVLWRLSWAIPVAALVGVLGSEAVDRARLPAARAASRGRRRRSADRLGHAAVVERLGERRVGFPGVEAVGARAGRGADGPRRCPPGRRHPRAAAAEPGDPEALRLRRRRRSDRPLRPGARCRARCARRRAGAARAVRGPRSRDARSAARPRRDRPPARRGAAHAACGPRVRPARGAPRAGAAARRPLRPCRGDGEHRVHAPPSGAAAAMIRAHAQPPVDRRAGRGRARRLRR